MARVALRLVAVAAVLSAQAFVSPAARHPQRYHQQRPPLARPAARRGALGALGMVSSVPRTAATGGASPDDPRNQRKYFGVPAVPKKAPKANGKTKRSRTEMSSNGGPTFDNAAAAAAADGKTADEMAKLQAELEATQAKLEAAQKAMSDLLVKGHEAKLGAIESATAPLEVRTRIQFGPTGRTLLTTRPPPSPPPPRTGRAREEQSAERRDAEGLDRAQRAVPRLHR